MRDFVAANSPRKEEIPDNSISLILSDPPYDHNSLPLYGDLGRLAVRVLMLGGSLVTYIGQYWLPQFVNEIAASGLTYWWTFCLRFKGSQQRMHQRGVYGWKPLLWFVKGDKRMPTWRSVDDVIESLVKCVCRTFLWLAHAAAPNDNSTRELHLLLYYTVLITILYYMYIGTKQYQTVLYSTVQCTFYQPTITIGTYHNGR
jgi:hypothetical protein